MFDFNDTIIINKNEKCVHDVFEEQVISSSEVIAVKACDRTLTYNPNVDFPSETPCYCIYTSGSTGKPKGTILTNKSTVNFCNNIACNTVVNHLCNSKYISIVSVTTVGFDIFVTESLLPLTNGLTIVLANEEQAKIQNSLNNLLLEVSVDVLQTTPTKMKSLITDITQTEYLKNLKAIILGGEALDTGVNTADLLMI